ncbi:MAG: cytidyltransferase [Rhodospirillaceae bacterium]|nr:cytidyltransferase [Rhodospirillaceae bacterium]
MKRILVDMSATLIHHGHIRLLKRASSHGQVVVALTTDDEILKIKGYEPEIPFEERQEILQAMRYVDEVIPAPWLIDNNFLAEHNIDLLVHGDDNSNHVDKDKLLIFPRTQGISSTILRSRVLKVASSLVSS